MRIGIMLRHIEERGGIRVYTVNILKALLKIDRKNEYLMIYKSKDHLGRYSSFPNVSETVLPGTEKLWWDQVSIPRLAKARNLDIVYNPKLSIPLFTTAKTILVMHGAEQYAVPECFKWHDRIYFSVANRLYVRRASAIIAMTNIGKHDIARYMGASLEKIHVIPEAYNELCRGRDLEGAREAKAKYNLPERFILFVGGLTPLKNFGNLLRAFDRIREQIPQKLVIVGFSRWKVEKDFKLLDDLGLRDSVIFPGFIPDEDIPKFYSLADLFVMPSLYEGFGIPVLEAMACGCPVVTTKTGCSPEVAGGGAVLVDPYNPEEMARGMLAVLSDEVLRADLVRKGYIRAKEFTWEKCARETLELFESIAIDGGPTLRS
jgi:glycosyltransferase involved in cell wall biosynthesis